jgi:hypothetical protein
VTFLLQLPALTMMDTISAIVRQGIDSQHLLADRSDLLMGVKTKRHLHDGSRLISVVLTAWFQPRNCDSEVKLSCNLNNIRSQIIDVK